MNKKNITPALFANMIEDRRYCGKCGKIFSVFKCKKDKNNRIMSPCCENIFNNELICEHEAKGDCQFNGDFTPECGSNCKEYKEASWRINN